METKYKTHHIIKVVLLSLCLAGFPAGNSRADEDSKYLNAVREFADNVLKYGRDTYGPKHTPLFVDGLNIHTHEPVKWINKNGEKWILSNFASQQTLLRTLNGLSKTTGDPKYRDAAKQAIRYVFGNLRAPNGLIYWGYLAAYNAQADKVFTQKNHHTLKIDYPYYELMWQTDPNSTKEFIEAYWSAHVVDWSNLDINRIALFSDSLEEPWDHEYEGGPTFFKSKISWAHGFLTTGTSLAHAGTTLYKLSRQKQPLVWSQRLIKRFVDTRHPKTGIAAYQYNHPGNQLGEDLKEHFIDPYARIFPLYPFEFRSLDYPEERHPNPWMSMFLVGKMLGEDGQQFTQWALEEFTAWGKASYRKSDNSFVPMLTDGTNLEGYVWKEGPTGMNVAKLVPADPSYFWAYCVAYGSTGDEFMWEMVRDIALGNGFGDIGETPAHIPKLQTDTDDFHIYGLLGFLQLFEKTEKPVYLQMARRIGDNIVNDQFHKGFFVLSKRHIYTRFACTESLALLHLYVLTEGIDRSIPQVWPEVPLFRPPYRHKEEGVDRLIIYTLTDSNEPLLSLQEAAATGDVNLVKTLLESGTDVDVLDDTFLKTALHRAAIRGHKDVAELLLAKGAGVNARDWGCATPLHYAAEKGHKEIADLLIAKGADVNATDNNGRSPLWWARRHKEIVELLRKNGAKE
jgi:pectate lyase